MSWSRRNLLRGAAALAAMGTLAGCGFQPVYARRPGGNDIAERLNQVAISNIPDRPGQILRNLLIDRFYITGRPADPEYRLSVNLTAREAKLGIRKDETATRAQLTLIARYVLQEQATNQILLQTSSRAIVSYNILEDQYATLVTEEDAYERGLTRLSDDIATRISLYFTREA